VKWTLLQVKTYAGSVAELNCQLQALQQELEQKQTSVNCLQAKYDAERVSLWFADERFIGTGVAALV